MSDCSKVRIPEHRVAELLAEAARLHDNAGYSLMELQQICSKARIPPRTVKQGLRKIKANRQKQATRCQTREYTKLTLLFLTYVSVLSVGITLFLKHRGVLSLVSAAPLVAIILCGIFISFRWLSNQETFMSSHLKSHIPEDMASEVVAEAARLHTKDEEGYSLSELQQACSEAGISSHIVDKAFRKIEEKRRRKRINRRKQKKFIERYAREGASVGIGLLISVALFTNGITPFSLIVFFCILAAIPLFLT